MSHSPYVPSPFDAIAGYLDIKEARRQAAQDAMSEGPRVRAATAIVINKNPDAATVETIAVVDFYADNNKD